jgi:predicted PurR-regulated permease PerM
MPAASSFYSRTVAVAVAAALSYALLLIFKPLALPMIWAAFLAFLLQPLNAWLRRRFKGKGLAAGLLTVFAPLAILLPLSLLSAEFVVQISAMLRGLQRTLNELDIKTFSDLQQFPLMARLNAWLGEHTGITAEQVQAWLLSGTRTILQDAASVGGSLFLGAVGSVVSFGIMLAVLFFFLRDGDLMVVRLRRHIPLDEARKERLFSRLSHVSRAIVFSMSVASLLQGVLIWIGFTVAHLPSAVVFGVLAAVLTMLPLVGSAFVSIPASVWLFLNGQWGYGTFMLVWGLLAAGADNFVRPLLISGRAPISALAVFVGVLGGLAAFGPIGIIAGPVVLALAMALIEFAEESPAQIS